MWVVNMGHILQLLIFETVLLSIDWFCRLRQRKRNERPPRAGVVSASK